MNSESCVCVIRIESVLLCLSVLKELECYLLEECVGKNVLFLLHIGLDLLSESVKLGSELICGTAINSGGVADDLLYECGIDLHGSLTVLTFNESLEFLGYHLVSLATDNVEYCLSTNDLRGRSYERRIACISSYSRNFLKNLSQLIRLTCLLELRNEVGEHSAGNLVDKCVYVYLEHLGVKQTACEVLLTYGSEVLGDLVELLEVDAGVVLGTAEGCNERLRRRLSCDSWTCNDLFYSL